MKKMSTSEKHDRRLTSDFIGFSYDVKETLFSFLNKKILGPNFSENEAPILKFLYTRVIITFIMITLIIFFSMSFLNDQVSQIISYIILGIFFLYFLISDISITLQMSVGFLRRLFMEFVVLYMFTVSILIPLLGFFIFKNIYVKLMLLIFFILCFIRILAVDAVPKYLIKTFTISSFVMLFTMIFIQSNIFFNFWPTEHISIDVPSINLSYSINTFFYSLIFSYILLYGKTLYKMIFKSQYLVFIQNDMFTSENTNKITPTPGNLLT